jgi:hypothetical protein
VPTRRFQPLKAKDTQTDQAYSEISQVIDALAPLELYKLRTEARVNAAAGTFMRLAPRSAGMEVSIPRAEASNFGQTITFFVKSSAGSLRLRASSGTINGANAITYGAGITAVIVLVSDGESGWATSTALGSLPDIPAGTVIGNPVDGADPGSPVAMTGAQVGEVLLFNTLQTLNLGAGSFPTVVLDETATVVRLSHGGNTAIVQGIVAPARKGRVVFFSSNSGGGDETIFLDEDAAASANDRIRTPGGIPLRIISGRWVMMVYLDIGSTERWVVIGPPTGLYLTSEQTVSGSGPHDVTLLGGTNRLTFSGTDVVVNSVTGGTDTGRLIEMYFTGSGLHTVINRGLGGGNEANIFNPGDSAQFFGPRGSYLIQANGAAGWRGLHPIHGREVLGLARRTAITTITNSASSIVAATLTLPANSISAGDAYRMRCQYRYDRGSTATARNLTLQMHVDDGGGVDTTSSGGLATQTTNPSAGSAGFDLVVSFLGTPGAAMPYTVTGTFTYFGLTATPTVVIQQMQLLGLTNTVDTTAAITLDMTAALSGATANLSLSCVMGTIEKI